MTIDVTNLIHDGGSRFGPNAKVLDYYVGGKG